MKNSVAEVATDVEIRVKCNYPMTNYITSMIALRKCFFVTDTMPHKIKNITVQPFSDSALRVAWVPGYDGGYQQNFMVWYVLNVLLIILLLPK